MLKKSNLFFPKIPKFTYQPQSPDTDINADIYFFQKWRQLSLKQRIARFISHERGVKKLCLIGIKSRHRNLSIQEIRDLFIRAVLGEKFTPDFQPKGINENMWIQDSISLAGELHQLFESINIDYYVNRGVASSIHGEPRSTRDLDLVIEVKPNQIDLLVKNLEASGYYCPASAVEDLQRDCGNMLNITHTETIANADIYITDNSPYSISQMNRRILINVDGIPVFWIASAEDIILQKLRWGKGSKSEKQWRDVLGIIKLQAENLDYSYLTEWAENLDLVADLSEVLTQAGI
ncbi:hypothetical protein [Anabaena sp. UHCC 0204]|uniref:hypothetical protein n=1 Tax=Anabaena sp. UHCC 0204 TaxID=2590009 RepID=UPI0014464BFB|nr:hypothetical protein [Anabaena sp. UHCC 0204]MTJ09849.1 hypothetical protein [Anabaena sp. UHCC 0204]